MHELSLIVAITEMITCDAALRGITRVTQVEIEVGELSGGLPIRAERSLSPGHQEYNHGKCLFDCRGCTWDSVGAYLAPTCFSLGSTAGNAPIAPGRPIS